MKIIGFSLHRGGVHDNSVALIEDGKVLFAEAEERLSRLKHDGRFPWLALKEALKFTRTPVRKVDFFVTATPEENFGRMFLTSLRFIPAVGLKNYFTNLIKRLFYRRPPHLDSGRPQSFEAAGLPKEKLLKVSHYLAHAAASYYAGPWDDCLVIAMDGFGLGAKGEPLSGQIFRGKEGKLTLVESVPIWGSLGFYYGAVTLALGFKLNDGEGKTMGLAAYGNWRKCYGAMGRFFPSFRNKRWVVKPSIMDLLNIPRKEIFAASPTFLLLKNYIEKYGRENVAAACQKVFEEELMKYLKYLVAKYKIRKLNLVGGIFLNVKANMKILEEEVADEIFIYPNPTDGGTAAGAALVGYLLVGGKFKREELLHPAFGRSFSDTEILKELKKIKGVVYRKIKRNLPELTAQLLAKQKVVGWFQGRGEWGPRALGQRSVLADPRNLANKDRINDILKGREWFMPFAPSMLVEAAPRYLKMLTQAPFMIIADRLKKGKDKDLIAAIHVDKTVRPHMVTAEANPLYYDVIKEFAKITGVAAILNTSFNKHGLPIVYTPKEAIEHLLWKTIDVLVIGNYLVQRKK